MKNSDNIGRSVVEIGGLFVSRFILRCFLSSIGCVTYAEWSEETVAVLSKPFAWKDLKRDIKDVGQSSWPYAGQSNLRPRITTYDCKMLTTEISFVLLFVPEFIIS